MMRRALVRLTVWGLRWLFARDHNRFIDGLEHLQNRQSRLLHDIIGDLSQTVYGRDHGLDRTDGYLAFAAKLPLTRYEDLEPYLKRQIEGESRVITTEAFIHIEPTSGSRGAVKAIPYTKAMKQAFGRMFRIWAYDLLSKQLSLQSGRIFISQSPQSPINRETQYLGGWLEALIGQFLVRQRGEHPDFLMDVSLALLRADDLEVISVWSPSYLTVILDYIEQNKVTIRPHLSASRANVLQDPINWPSVWPHLQLISCWDEGQARPLAQELAARFPGVTFQGKGLLATEAPLSMPITAAKGALPLYDSVFFEFLRDDGSLALLSELTVGTIYEVVITTASGLIRYRLGDLIRVTGQHRGAPVIAFHGRGADISDMVGEKLSEAFVRGALTPLIPSGRFLLLPDAAQRRYVLLSEDSEDISPMAEAALNAAYHYQLARQQSQLGAIKAVRVHDLLGLIKRFATGQGQAMGHVKDTALLSDPVKAAALLKVLTGENSPHD
jgi:GH3 auxin-responsive promoter